MFRPLLAALALVGVVLLPTTATAAAASHAGPRSEDPLSLTAEVTDRAGVLDDADAVQRELERVRSDGGPQLFVAYVDSFDGADPEQ